MANTITVRKLQEGTKGAVFHVYLKCDGVSGELTDQVLIDPTSDFSPALTAGADVTVTDIWWNFAGFDGMLEFDATADTPIWKMAGSTAAAYVDFNKFGGVKDSGGAGATGKIQITTQGFTAATDEGTLVIQIRKN